MASPLFAQSRWTAEMRGGANVADDEFSGVELKTGSGLELGVRVRTTPNLFVYGAWDWQNRAAKTPLFGARADVEDTGFTFGVGYVVPLGTRVKPWVRVGGLLSHVEIDDEPAKDQIANSGYSFGVEVAGGLEVPLNDRWSLTPGLRYRRFEPKVRFGGRESSTTLAYVAVDVGVAVKF